MDKETETKTYNKFHSRRFWICVWAMVLITGIVVGSYIRDNYELSGLAAALTSIVVAYTGIETWNKKYKLKQPEDQE